jgi:hypothetical protein
MSLIMNSKGERVEAASLLNDQELSQAEFLTNAAAHQYGYNIDVTTLTAILKTVAEQKFYEIPFADYVPTRVGEGTAWASNITAFRTFVTGGDFEKGYIDQGNGTRLATTDAAVDALTIPVKTWAKELSWSLPEIAEASRTGVWDIVSAKEKSRKKNWDLGLQKTVFLGSFDGALKGALNLSDVTVNTTAVTAKISEMSVNQINAFAASLVEVYQANNNYTAYPDYLWVPQSDYNGLGTYVSQYMLRTRKEILERAVSDITGKPFEIKPLVYAMANKSDGKLSYDRYVLGRYDEEVSRFDIPVDYTVTVANSIEGFTFRNVGYAQHSGVLSLRPQELLYLDNQSGS